MKVMVVLILFGVV